jgi:protein-S-isoprenylcysteine O-methyltransferase Ste14
VTSSGSELQNGAGVALPPPLVFVGLLTVGVLFDRLVTGWFVDLPGFSRYTLAVVLAAAGLLLLAGAIRLFRRAGTRPEPWKPTTAIVTSGVYRLTRNPMYVGMAFVHAAIAIAFASPTALVLLPVAILVIYQHVIRKEERYLEAIFGAEYLAYKSRVRRWI